MCASCTREALFTFHTPTKTITMKKSKKWKASIAAFVAGAAIIMGTASFTNQELTFDALLGRSDDRTDAQFLAQAALIHLEEIQLGQLAQQKSYMTDVKDLGALLEKEHTQSLRDLNMLADRKGISLPTSTNTDAKDAYKRLNKESEKKFNKDYCAEMIKGHEKAIGIFEAASKEAQDTEIREWASATLPTLRKHLDHAKLCKAKCDKV